MGRFETVLELSLVVLLVVTLVHAIRLQRALTLVRKDRALLDSAVAGFDSGTRQAEQGIQRLRDAARTVAGQLDEVASLKDDLAFLAERGTQVADRLDVLVRAARPLSATADLVGDSGPSGAAPVRSQAERDLLLALRGARP